MTDRSDVLVGGVAVGFDELAGEGVLPLRHDGPGQGPDEEVLLLTTRSVGIVDGRADALQLQGYPVELLALGLADFALEDSHPDEHLVAWEVRRLERDALPRLDEVHLGRGDE